MKNTFQYKIKISIVENIIAIYENGNLDLALKALRDYLEKYPKDKQALYLYGKINRLLGNMEEAREVLLYLVSVLNKNKYLFNVYIELIFLESFLRNYEDAYKYFLAFQNLQAELEYPENELGAEQLCPELMHLFLMKKLGILKLNYAREDYKYFERQIIGFQQEDFENYYFTYNRKIQLSSSKENYKQYFNEFIDLEKLYQDVLDVLPFAIRTSDYNIFDTYYIQVPNVGRDKEGILNHIKVVALFMGDDSKILDITPCRILRYKRSVVSLKDLKMKRLMFLNYGEENPVLKKEL